MYVSVDIDVDDVLPEISTEKLQAELEGRPDCDLPRCPTLLTIYDEFRQRGDAPQCLRDYLFAKLGRILP